jgi:hypothetical protein
MPTETEIIDHIAGYCAWLEQELGVSMHRDHVIMLARSASGMDENATAIVPAQPAHSNRRPGRLAMALVAAGIVASIVGVTYLVTGSPPTRRLSPAPDSTPEETALPGTAVESMAPTTYAPLALPDGLVVWDVGATVGDRPVMTQQLFGTYGTANTLDVALLLKIQPATSDNVVDRSIPTVGVRGLEADNLLSFPGSPEEGTSLEWVENGFVIEATGTMPLEDAVTLLNGLQWRAEPSQGFDPSTSSVPLVDEESSVGKPWSDAVVLYVTGPQGPADTTGSPSLTERILVPGEATIAISNTPQRTLTPELTMYGERQLDGSISLLGGSTETADGDVVVSGTRIEPDGTVVQITAEQTLWPTLADAMEPATAVQLAGLVFDANQRLLQLPEIASTGAGVAQVVLRGNNATNPSTICLRIAGDEQCRSSRAQQQRPNWTEVVEVGKRWFVIGRQPATDPPPVAFAWQPGPAPTADDAIQPDLTAVVGDDLLWYARLPASPRAVASGHITAQGAVVDMLGRPNSGALWSGWARPPWSPSDNDSTDNTSSPITAQPSTTVTGNAGGVAVNGPEPGRVHPEEGAYILQPDDLYVSNIAARFKVSLEDILAINGLTLDDNNFVPGWPPPGTAIRIPPGWTEPTGPTSETTMPTG